MGEDDAGDRKQLDEHQARPASLDHRRVEFAQERSFGSAEYPQAATAALRALREQTLIDGGSPRWVQIPARESKAMGNFWDSLTAEQRVAFRAKAHKRVKGYSVNRTSRKILVRLAAMTTASSGLCSSGPLK